MKKTSFFNTKPTEIKVLLSFILLNLFFQKGLTGPYRFVSGEVTEDFIRYLFSLESLASGQIPLWNPFVDNGQPFFFYLILTSFPSPIDFALAVVFWIARFIPGLTTVALGQFVQLFAISLGSFILYKLIRLLIRQSGIHTNSNSGEIIFSWIGGFMIMLFMCERGVAGLNVVFIDLHLFPLFLLYYLLRWLWDGAQVQTLAKVVLSGLLSLHYSGSYAVPYAIFLLCLVAFMLLIPGTKAFLPYFIKQAKPRITKEVYQNLGVLLLAGLCLSPFIYVYLVDFPTIARYGRELSLIDFREFVQAQNGQDFVYFSYNLNYEGPYPMYLRTGLLFFSLLALFHTKTWRTYLPFLLVIVLVGSVYQGVESPFLILIYSKLAPALQKIFYLRIYYDIVCLIIWVFGFVGIWIFCANRPNAGEILAFVPFLGYLLYMQKDLGLFGVMAFTWFLLVLNNLFLVRRFKFPLQWLMVVCVVGIGMEQAFAYKSAISGVGGNSEGWSEIINKELLWHRPYPTYRTHRLNYPIERWGNGRPLLLEEVCYLTEPNFLSLKKQMALHALFSEEQKAKFFSKTAPLVRWSEHYETFSEEERLQSRLAEGVLYDVLLTQEESDNPAPPQGNSSVLDFGLNHILIQSYTAGPNYLIWSDAWYPGWKVWVDSKEATIIKANGNFKAVWVPDAGNHKIEFRFWPAIANFYLLDVVGFWILLGFIGFKSDLPNSFIRRIKIGFQSWRGSNN